MQNRYDILKNKVNWVHHSQTNYSKELLQNHVNRNVLLHCTAKYVLEYLQNSLKYYRERLTITEERWKVGRISWTTCNHKMTSTVSKLLSKTVNWP